MYLKLNDIELCCEPGTRWKDLLRFLPDGGKGTLGIRVKGKTHGLNESAQEYVYAATLTFADEEGRRIYERSLCMLFLCAVSRVFPALHVRMEHSLGRGIMAVVPRAPKGWTEPVEAEMRRIVAEDAPFIRKSVSTSDALRYFEENGQIERLRILRYREFDFFTLYDLLGYEDYFYGEMAASAGMVGVFSLVPLEGGALLMMPDIADPSRPSEYVPMPKLLETFTETAKWCRITGCSNASDLNDMLKERRLREFIRVSEALQERRIQEIADKFIESGARVMLIAGPSSSGKTTFAHRLNIALRVHGLRPVKLSLDDYYRDRDSLPLEPDGTVDLERLDALDVPLLCEHLPLLLEGKTVDVPTFDFKTGTRGKKTHRVRVEKGQPIIIEGIHGLNDALTASVPREMKFKIYISALTTLNLDDHNRIRTTDARLLRRIVRDHNFRGTPPEETIAMWSSVRHGEDNYIFPFQEEADVMFNSSLPYELMVMKKYAYPALKEIKPDSPHYTLARRLVKFLNYIRVADVEDEIPLNSLLREFIGGCCFYKEED